MIAFYEKIVKQSSIELVLTNLYFVVHTGLQLTTYVFLQKERELQKNERLLLAYGNCIEHAYSFTICEMYRYRYQYYDELVNHSSKN